MPPITSRRLGKVAASLRVKRIEAAAERQIHEEFHINPRSAALKLLRRQITQAKNFPRKPDPTIDREELPRGWLLPMLLQTDDLLTGRWDYWTRTRIAGKLLDEPIPYIEFFSEGNVSRNPARRMLEASLDCIPTHGAWQTWGSTTYMDYFLDWLLYGFGHHKEMPSAPLGCERACSRLYQVFCLEALLAYPYDYFGDMLAETRFGKHAGFYPTPHHVTRMMAEMSFGEGDSRTQSVHDPCVGTGRMLLFASNYSLRLSGVDILSTCVKATTVNLYLFAPWGAKPLSFL